MNAEVTPLVSPAEIPPTNGMDRVIQRRRPMWPIGLAVAAIAGAVALVLVLRSGSGPSLRVQSQHISVSSVTNGRFDDFIPIRGRIAPLKTVFLDAIEGGRVEEVLVEDGAVVAAGQLLARLSNSRLQLDVIGREAEITEQQNNLSSLALSLERNRLEHKRQLIEAEYQITRLDRLVRRRQGLVGNGLVSAEELQDLQDEFEYWQRRRTVRQEAQVSDERLQEAQLVQLRDSVTQLSKNLVIARSNLDSLNVRAPVAGKLTSFSIEVGQSLARGERYGQIDDPSNFKLVISIDEFYLNRIDLGQQAVVNHAGSEYPLEISKIYPQVRDGQFLADMRFVDAQPANARRGQTLRAQLFLGAPEPAVLIPNGAFYQDTGGQWVFVLNADSSQAVRRTVTLGRRNATYIEVLDGLQVGERIITSPYVSFLDMQRLALTD